MRTRILTMLACLLLSVFTGSFLYADVYQPAYLELKQTGEETYDVLWKVPAKGGDRRLGLYIQFSEEVRILTPANATFVSGAYIERSTIGRDSGLAGATITIQGLERFSTDVLTRIQRLDGSSETARLDATSTSFTVQGAARFLDVVSTYLVFGVEHILQGLDHLLFVACLILIAGSWRRILITITGFTVAHSITLTLSALEVVQLPVPPIEATIALSIVFLAREIALNRRDTLTWRYPVAVSASFGLLHGFGFASALREIGLPQTEIPAALAAFNIGVELGQVLFVTVILLVFMLITKSSRLLRFDSVCWLNKMEMPVAYVVGGITMYWTLERVTAFWV